MDAILVVDDEHSVRELLYSILSRRHWVATASGADEAIAMLGMARYDLLVSDLRMRGTDGLDLIAEAATRWPDLRTVLLSGYVTDEVIEKAEVIGISEVIEKPFDAHSLQTKLDRVLAEARSSREAHLSEAAAG